MKLTTKQLKAINDASGSIFCEYVDIAYMLERLDDDFTFDDIVDVLGEAIADVEVIYYSNAIDFLSENDPSLINSINLLTDMGYTDINNVNSELLATVLLQDMLHQVMPDVGEICNILNGDYT